MPRLQNIINKELKYKAESILEQIGLTPKVALTMFYREIVVQRTLPFHPSKATHIPNELTAETIEKADKGEDIVACDDIDDLVNKLNK